MSWEIAIFLIIYLYPFIFVGSARYYMLSVEQPVGHIGGGKRSGENCCLFLEKIIIIIII